MSIAACIAATLAHAQIAAAATATTSGGTLTYTAAPGETNLVNVSLASGTFTIVDGGAPVVAGAGCSLPAAGRATCSSSGIGSIRIDAGDGNDVITLLPSTPATIGDGPGDDLVTAGSGADTFTGGPGNDIYFGGSGNDEFEDGGGTGADTFNGGGGTDKVSYSTRTSPVTATIDDTANDGVAGEGDNVKSDVESLQGGQGGDSLTGSSSGNLLQGLGGEDTLNGGAGDDTFDGGTGADSINGGAGTHDVADYSARTNAVTATIDDRADDGESGEGDNLHTDLEGINGGSASDFLGGGPGNDTLNGGAGDDTFQGGPGADTFSGGSGQDTADYSDHSSGVTVDDDGVADDGSPGEGDNVGTDVDNFIGTPGNDRITGSTWFNTIDGEGGDDVLSGGDGNDTLYGGPGNDTLNGNNNDDLLDGGSGADRMNGGSGTDTADYSSRSAGVDVTLDDQWNDGEAGEGDDVASDVDKVLGGQGPDHLTGDGDANTLNGNGGNDRIDGGGGDDSLNGGDGRDSLNGSGGKDKLDGGTGDDVLDGGTSADTLTGGDGRDLADYSSRWRDVTVDLDNNSDDGEGGERDNVRSDVEDIAGGSGDDRLTGDGDANALWGNGGDDTLIGGTGPDTFSGGAGADTADYSDRSHSVSVSIGDGRNDGEAGESDDVLGDVENAKGGSANDDLTGDGTRNVLSGNGGSDILTGGGGPDQLNGGSGTDTVDFSDRGAPVTVDLDANTDSDGDGFGDDIENATGGGGNDTLIGGGGRNVLDGGAGDDVLDGRAGADTLIGGPGTDGVDYSRRTDPVKVTLDGQANDGESGENDYVGIDVENATGGAAADHLTGSDGPNRLDGAAGNDTLDANGGNDSLLGGSGNDNIAGDAGTDTIDAGTGNDTVDAVDGKKDVVGCGAGKDRASTDKADKRSSCELKGKAGDMPASPTPGKPSSPGTPKGVKVVRSKGKFVGIPGFPGERIDSRLLHDFSYLKSKYHVAVTDGFALQGHEPGGEHPIGLALDLVPGAGGSWNDVDRLAKWAEPRQNHPRAPFRWVGYNGDAGHGRGNHLHLSWMHAPSRRGHPAKWVEVLSFHEPPVVRPFGPLDKLAFSSNSSIGHAPSVKSGLHVTKPCSGSGPLRSTWKSAAKAFHLNWKILAAITQIESGLGCNMGPSSAGAVGWTQFMPATWRQWGMDANGDRHASPYNSIDAIFSTARYLRANGAPKNYHQAIFAYNHADWYVREVLGLSHKFNKPVTPLALKPQLEAGQTVLPAAVPSS